MANTLANASDWYLDLLNRLHILPANAATLLRSISAKQLGDKNFRPRPLTTRNFTDAELDAIHQLASTDKGYAPIQFDSYSRIKGFKGSYGDENLPVSQYLSPARVVSTTLGCAGIRNKDGKADVVDTYDFNKKPMKIFDRGDGTFTGSDGLIRPMAELKAYMKDKMRGMDTWYGRFRNNSASLAHSSDDPDSSKIKATISLDEIKKKLGDRLGTFDVNKDETEKGFTLRGIAGGALTAAPVGAALGTLVGATQLVRPKKRKHWARTLAGSALTGAAIASLAGATGGGVLANQVYKKFSKSGSAPQKPKKRKSRLGAVLTNMALYGIPLSATVGGVLYGKKQLDALNKKLLANPTAENEYNVVNADSEAEMGGGAMYYR